MIPLSRTSGVKKNPLFNSSFREETLEMIKTYPIPLTKQEIRLLPNFENRNVSQHQKIKASYEQIQNRFLAKEDREPLVEGIKMLLGEVQGFCKLDTTPLLRLLEGGEKLFEVKIDKSIGVLLNEKIKEENLSIDKSSKPLGSHIIKAFVEFSRIADAVKKRKKIPDGEKADYSVEDFIIVPKDTEHDTISFEIRVTNEGKKQNIVFLKKLKEDESDPFENQKYLKIRDYPAYKKKYDVEGVKKKYEKNKWFLEDTKNKKDYVIKKLGKEGDTYKLAVYRDDNHFVEFGKMTTKTGFYIPQSFGFGLTLSTMSSNPLFSEPPKFRIVLRPNRIEMLEDVLKTKDVSLFYKKGKKKLGLNNKAITVIHELIHSLIREVGCSYFGRTKEGIRIEHAYVFALMGLFYLISELAANQGMTS